jgi:hypothetical protein
MTTKEKAQQLVYAFEAFTDCENELEFAKECALIAVDEIINYLLDSDWALVNNKAKYWEEVKQEILNL